MTGAAKAWGSLDEVNQRPKTKRNPADGPSRNPPEKTKRSLRGEVGYGCPVRGCGSPYLEYHHFDPPWADEHHHRPEGMIALCEEHHTKAGAGAFTLEQLREMKASPYAKTAAVSGRFDWRRNQIVAVIGGNFYVETPTMVQVGDQPAVTQRRDDQGILQLSLDMVTTTSDPRLRMVDHEWYLIGSPIEFDSPVSGKRIHALYGNGDELTIDFWEAKNVQQVLDRYSYLDVTVPPNWLAYPLTFAEIQMHIGGTTLGFTKASTETGNVSVSGGWTSNALIGFRIDVIPPKKGSTDAGTS